MRSRGAGRDASRRLALVIVLVASAAGCDRASPTQPEPACTASLSAASASFGADGGAGSVGIVTPAGCAWTVTSTSSWVTVSGTASGSGPSTIGYAVAANGASESRQSTLTIAGLTHTISQQGRPAVDCAIELTPAAARIGKDAANGTFEVKAAAGCGWTASSRTAWLTLVGGSAGTGDGEVRWTAARNPDPAERAGAVMVADRTFTLTQDGDAGGCTYTVTPVTVAACMPAGTFAVMVTTQASCPWTAATDAPWLGLPGGGAGDGSATVVVQYGENYDAPRQGTVLLRWPTPTAGQNVHLSQAGCRYAVTRSSFAFTAPGGAGTFDVLQQSDPTECGGATQDRCIWTPVASQPWIVLGSTGPRSGDQPVSFTVTANDTTAPRSGTITLRDQVVVVTQSGR
jgi:Putative binding domain, N-terminal/Viral BACON domain